jgi:hypothetical protein
VQRYETHIDALLWNRLWMMREASFIEPGGEWQCQIIGICRKRTVSRRRAEKSRKWRVDLAI